MSRVHDHMFYAQRIAHVKTLQCPSHTVPRYASRMTPAERLRSARTERGYATAKAAADAFGWVRPTYYGHENGARSIDPETAERYAAAFGVDAAWLLYGDGTGFAEPAVVRLSRANAGAAADPHLEMRMRALFPDARTPELWRMTVPAAGFGLLAGDILALDLAAVETDGDLVVVNHVDAAGHAETLICRVAGAYFVAADPLGPRPAMARDGGPAARVGVVVGMIRHRPGAIRSA